MPELANFNNQKRPDVGSIRGPKNKTAMNFANFAGKYNKARKKLPAFVDMFLPAGELPEELWTKRAYGDNVSNRDYFDAMLGLL